MKSKIHQVAREAGVSTATVSRVFNGRPYVREALKKKVLETTQRLNYLPKLTARKVNIAILVEGLKSLRLGTYENILLAFLTEYIIGNRYTFEIITVNEFELIRRNFLDVIIAISYNPVTTEKIKAIKGSPILSINNPIPGSHHICSDHKQGIESAVDYLVAKGHKRIGLFQRNEESWGSKERIIGYKKSIKKQGLPYQEGLVEIAENSTCLEAIVKIFRYQPTAFIISGENASLEVIHALNLLHKKIPQDISVISFENDSVSPYLNPPHTTISQGLEEISKATVKKAKDIIEGKIIAPVEVVIKNTLIERDSVRTLKKIKQEKVSRKPNFLNLSTMKI